MPQGTSRILIVAETDLLEVVTRVGFLLSYSALMGVVISTTVPFLSYDWSSVWPSHWWPGLSQLSWSWEAYSSGPRRHAPAPEPRHLVRI